MSRIRRRVTLSTAGAVVLAVIVAYAAWAFTPGQVIPAQAPGETITTVNDTDFTYGVASGVSRAPCWVYTSPSDAQALATDAHSSNCAGDVYSYSFTGDRVWLYSDIWGGDGIAEVFIDGTLEWDIDEHGPVFTSTCTGGPTSALAPRSDQVELFDSGPPQPIDGTGTAGLSYGAHTIVVEVTGTRDPDPCWPTSGGQYTYVFADRLDYEH